MGDSKKTIASIVPLKIVAPLVNSKHKPKCPKTLQSITLEESPRLWKILALLLPVVYQDYSFAKGCCASVRYFLGDVPIALIVDGTFSVSSLEEAYQVQVINHHTISNEILKKRSFGWGKTKMIAFWESPWQHFLYLDADTNVWGNVLKYQNFDQFDVLLIKLVMAIQMN
jgi:hypothetical protein